MTDIDSQTSEQEQPYRGYVHIKTLAHLDIVDLDDGEMPFIPKSTLLTRQKSRTLLQAIAKVRNIGNPDNNHIEQTLFTLWQRSRYFKSVYVGTLSVAIGEPSWPLRRITLVADAKYDAPRSSYVQVDIDDDGLEESDADFRLTTNVDEYMSAFYPYNKEEKQLHTFKETCAFCEHQGEFIRKTGHAVCSRANEIPRSAFESTINQWLVSIRARQVETSVSNGLWTLLARFV